MFVINGILAEFLCLCDNLANLNISRILFQQSIFFQVAD